MYQEVKEAILKCEKEGKIVVPTLEGLETMPIEELINQPTEGLLYDLNRDRVTILTRLDNNDPKAVNDYAVMLVIKKLKEYYDKYKDLCK